MPFFPSRRIGLALTAVLLTTAGAAAVQAAECGGAIRFQPGTVSGTVAGKIKGYDACDYTLSARKGQVMHVTLDAANGVEAIAIGPVEHNFIAEPKLTLPQDGKYTLRVLQTRNAARKGTAARPYTMKVSIEGAAKAAPAVKSAPVVTPPAAVVAQPAMTQQIVIGNTVCETSRPLTADIGNYSGAIAGDGLCSFTFQATKGQTLTMLMDAAPEIDAIIYDPVSVTLTRDEGYVLPQTGTYTVRVLQNRAAARASAAPKPYSMVLNLD